MQPLTLGERIALLRRRHRLTQQQLAARLGVAQSEIHRLERGGVKDPHMSRVVALAQALHVTTDWLVGLRDRADEADSTPPTPPRTAAPVG
jgi:transcriptional regulator with XRE-family HTH domain